MRRMRRLLLACALVSGLPTVAGAQSSARPAKKAATAKAARVARPAAKARELAVEQAGMTMLLPTGWSSERAPGETEAYTLLGPDGVTTLMLFTVPARDTEAAIGDLDKTLRGVVTEASLDEPRKGEVGGMAALMADGQGKVDGHDVDLGLLLVFNEGRQRVLFIVGFSLPGQSGDYAKDVAAILHSVKPVR